LANDIDNYSHDMKYIYKLSIISIFTFLFIFLSACRHEQLGTYENSIRNFRKDHLNAFLEEDRSPLNKSDFQHVSFFIADSTYKVEAEYTMTPEAKAFDVKTSADKTKSYKSYARLNFSLNEENFELHVYESMRYKDIEEYKDYLFLPFTDLTNGESTYGGGRYLDLDKKDFKEGRIIVDFNKCYNPWCAYSDGFNCPVPPRENDLDIQINAGERMYLGPYKKLQPK